MINLGGVLKENVKNEEKKTEENSAEVGIKCHFQAIFRLFKQNLHDFEEK